MVMGTIQVGTLAVATRDTAICRAGELGVCYELYTIGNRPGYSFIFERGGYNGFSPQDVELFLEVTGVVIDIAVQHLDKTRSLLCALLSSEQVSCISEAKACLEVV